MKEEKDDKLPWWLWLLMILVAALAASGAVSWIDKLFGE